jgi:hypothetical protein
MIRKILMAGLLATVAIAAGASAEASKGGLSRPLDLPNVTVVAKTSPFPVIGAITVEPCGVEDCSDTP